MNQDESETIKFKYDQSNESQQNQYCEPCHDNVMILLCHAPDDVVQERRDARGHGHARAVLRDVLAHVLVVVVNTQSVVLRSC